MLRPKQIIGFIIRWAIVYSVLMFPWPGIEHGYAWLFQHICGAVFDSFGSEGRRVALTSSSPEYGRALPDWFVEGTRLPDKPKGDLQDTLIILRSQSAPMRFTYRYLTISSRLIGYAPTIWLISLIAAKVLPWRRWLLALFWGMVLIHLFIGLRVGVTIVEGFSGSVTSYDENDEPVQKNLVKQPEPATFGGKLLQTLAKLLRRDLTVTLIVPTFIWFAVSFRRNDWAMLTGDATGPPDKAIRRQTEKPQQQVS